MSEMIPVSGCIVAYNNRGEILECLSALKAQTKGVSLSLFVSDNGSDDGTPAAVRAAFPDVSVIENGRVAESGTHQELIEQGGNYARMNRIQRSEEKPTEMQMPLGNVLSENG